MPVSFVFSASRALLRHEGEQDIGPASKGDQTTKCGAVSLVVASPKKSSRHEDVALGISSVQSWSIEIHVAANKQRIAAEIKRLPLILGGAFKV